MKTKVFGTKRFYYEDDDAPEDAVPLAAVQENAVRRQERQMAKAAGTPDKPAKAAKGKKPEPEPEPEPDVDGNAEPPRRSRRRAATEG